MPKSNSASKRTATSSPSCTIRQVPVKLSKSPSSWAKWISSPSRSKRSSSVQRNSPLRKWSSQLELHLSAGWVACTVVDRTCGASSGYRSQRSTLSYTVGAFSERTVTSSSTCRTGVTAFRAAWPSH